MVINRDTLLLNFCIFSQTQPICTKCLGCMNIGHKPMIYSLQYSYNIAFIEEMNLKFTLNIRLRVSYVRNSGRKHPVSYKHKENKRN